MARVSRETAAAHRSAMVRAASRLFRARGLERVGVAEITREAGLTHGGFYGHFASKEALAAEALAAAFADGRDHLATGGLDGYLRGYLSRSHRDHPETGCPIPALAADALRADDGVRRVFAEGLAGLLEAIAARLPVGDPDERRMRAIEMLATAVGGLALARVVAATDLAASDALLASLRMALRDRVASAVAVAPAQGETRGGELTGS